MPAYTVTGRVGPVVYTAVVDAHDSHPGSVGIVSGASSPNILTLLRQHEGEQVLASPVGPTTTLDLNDPESVMIGLTGLTRVYSATPSAPNIYAEADPPPASAAF